MSLGRFIVLLKGGFAYMIRLHFSNYLEVFHYDLFFGTVFEPPSNGKEKQK